MKLLLSAILFTGLLAAQAPPPLGIALESYSYPYPVHVLPLEIEGQTLRMAYMDVAPTGQPARGAVVLMHGKNFGGYYWGETARALSAAGYRVVIPDQIGWGKSPKPDIRYSFHLLAANTAKLLDSLGIQKSAVIGHSTGGMLATRFALVERVTQLILESPLGLEDYRTKIPPQSDDTLFRAELANTEPAKISAVYERYFVAPKRDVFGPLAEVQIRVTQSGEYPRWAKASALAYQMIYQQPVCYEFAQLKPPVLLIVGDKDHTVPMSSYASEAVRQTMGDFVHLAQNAVKQMPHGRLEIISNGGHIPHIEYADRFRKVVLAFLSTAESRE
jgi:pimeloyl-ACP methyl ester carboxylesterase